MLDLATALRSFRITPNKLYLSRSVYHDFYRSHFAIAHRDKFEKTVKIFGCDTDVYGCSDQRYTFRFRMKEMIKASPLGPFSIKINRAIRGL